MLNDADDYPKNAAAAPVPTFDAPGLAGQQMLSGAPVPGCCDAFITFGIAEPAEPAGPAVPAQRGSTMAAWLSASDFRVTVGKRGLRSFWMALTLGGGEAAWVRFEYRMVIFDRAVFAAVEVRSGPDRVLPEPDAAWLPSSSRPRQNEPTA